MAYTSGGYRKAVPGNHGARGIVHTPKLATQPEDLTRWESVARVLWARVSALGQFFISKTTAPADAEISTSEVGLYWDNTAGNPRLKAKGKDSAGTVFTQFASQNTIQVCETIALSDETTAITTGTAKVTWRAPWAFTLTGVRASLNTASSSGIPTVDINEAGTTVLSTKLTIDASEKTSVTAAAAAVISDSAIADDAEITFDIDVAGTGAKGLKVVLYGTRTAP